MNQLQSVPKTDLTLRFEETAVNEILRTIIFVLGKRNGCKLDELGKKKIRDAYLMGSGARVHIETGGTAIVVSDDSIEGVSYHIEDPLLGRSFNNLIEGLMAGSRGAKFLSEQMTDSAINVIQQILSNHERMLNEMGRMTLRQYCLNGGGLRIYAQDKFCPVVKDDDVKKIYVYLEESVITNEMNNIIHSLLVLCG